MKMMILQVFFYQWLILLTNVAFELGALREHAQNVAVEGTWDLPSTS